MTAPDVHDLATRQVLLEQKFDNNFQSFWKRYDDLTGEVKAHAVDDARQFRELRDFIEAKHAEAMEEMKELRGKFTAILSGIVVACVLMCINAAVIYSKGK